MRARSSCWRCCCSTLICGRKGWNWRRSCCGKARTGRCWPPFDKLRRGPGSRGKGLPLRQALSPVEGIEGVKEALPAELRPHLERLIERRLPGFDPKGAREALAACRRGLELRRLKAEKQATAALLAAWEEEVGASALAEAAVSAADRDERMKEVVSLHMKDMETGLRLHRKERSDDPDHIGETGIDG